MKVKIESFGNKGLGVVSGARISAGSIVLAVEPFEATLSAEKRSCYTFRASSDLFLCAGCRFARSDPAHQRAFGVCNSCTLVLVVAAENARTERGEAAKSALLCCRYASGKEQQLDWKSGHKEECKALERCAPNVPGPSVRLMARLLWKRYGLRLRNCKNLCLCALAVITDIPSSQVILLWASCDDA